MSIIPHYHPFLLLGSSTEYAFQICLLLCVFHETILMTSFSFLKRLRIFLVIRIKRTNSIEGDHGYGMENLKNSIYLKSQESSLNKIGGAGSQCTAGSRGSTEPAWEAVTWNPLVGSFQLTDCKEHFPFFKNLVILIERLIECGSCELCYTTWTSQSGRIMYW